MDTADAIPSLEGVMHKSISGWAFYWLFIEAFLLAGYLLNYGWAPRPHIMVTKQEEKQEYKPFNDPKVQQTAPKLVVTDVLGRTTDLASPSQTKKLIAFFSKCAECSLPYLRKLERFADQNRNMEFAVVFPSSQTNVALFFNEHSVRLPYAIENDLSVNRSYNVAWRPRLYLLDKDASMLYLQSFNDTFETALTRVGGLGKRNDGKIR